MALNPKTLKLALPNITDERAHLYAKPLAEAMRKGDIKSEKRAAAFLAQIGHESVDLLYMEEIASGAEYEGRSDLGNTHTGDGVRYKGRGPIQLTGRNNYRTAGKAIGVDLENNPKLAADAKYAFRIAVWFWNSRGLSLLADRGDFREITHRINGGFNGYEDRIARWNHIGDLGNQILPESPRRTRLRTAVRKLKHRLQRKPNRQDWRTKLKKLVAKLKKAK